MKAVTLVMFFVLTLFVTADEHVMVWSSKTDVYSEKGRVVATLPKGKFLQVHPHSKDESRYTIIVKGKKYNIRKKSVKSIADVVIIYKKKILDYSAEINKNDLRSSNIESELIGMYVKGLELERDTSLSYLKISNMVQANGQLRQYRGFSIMLSDGKYKKLKKLWTADIKTLFDEKAAIITKNQKFIAAIATMKSKINDFKNLGTLFAADSLQATNTGKPLVVIGKGAELYQKNKIVKTLKTGTKLMGYKSPKFPDWYDVKHDDGRYLISATSVVEVSKYKNLLTSKKTKAEYLIAKLESEIEIQQFRLKLYQAITRQLQADKFVANGYGLVKDLVVPIDKVRSFTIVSPAADKVYVNTLRASKVLKLWKTQVLDLTKESLKNQKLVLLQKKSLLDLNANLKKIK